MLTWRKSTAQQDAEHRLTISLNTELLCIVSSDAPTATTATTASATGVAPEAEQGGPLRLSGSGSGPGATDISLAAAAPAPSAAATSKGGGWIFCLRSADNAGGGEYVRTSVRIAAQGHAL